MSKTPVVKKPRKLSLKQKRFVAEYVKDGNGTKAARKTYGVSNDVVAGAIAYENLKKPQIENAIAEKLSDELLSTKHLALFNQKQLNYFTFAKDMSDDEITANVNAAGFAVIVIRESDKGKLAFYSIDDANAIKSALDMGYKIRGSYAPEKQIIAHAFVLPDEEKSRIDDILNNNI